MKATKTPKAVEEETEEQYLKYIIKDCTFNITINEGGKMWVQRGKPSPPPTPPGGH
jgi:hypothetical protein